MHAARMLCTHVHEFVSGKTASRALGPWGVDRMGERDVQEPSRTYH